MEIGNNLKSILAENTDKEDALDTLSFLELVELRSKEKSKEGQNILAGYEHGKFAEGVTEDNPLSGLGVAVAAPFYDAGKLLGLIKARSEPTPKALKQTYIGIGRGLKKIIQRNIKGVEPEESSNVLEN